MKVNGWCSCMFCRRSHGPIQVCIPMVIGGDDKWVRWKCCPDCWAQYDAVIPDAILYCTQMTWKRRNNMTVTVKHAQ